MSCTTNVYYYAVTTTYIVIAIIVVVIPRTQFNVTNSNCYCYYDDDCGVLIDSSMIIQPLEARRAAGKGMGQHGEEETWADCQNRGGRYVQRGGATPNKGGVAARGKGPMLGPYSSPSLCLGESAGSGDTFRRWS
jgi:hypothetical protein